jgi:hypothetical protein
MVTRGQVRWEFFLISKTTFSTDGTPLPAVACRIAGTAAADGVRRDGAADSHRIENLASKLGSETVGCQPAWLSSPLPRSAAWRAWNFFLAVPIHAGRSPHLTSLGDQ